MHSLSFILQDLLFTSEDNIRETVRNLCKQIFFETCVSSDSSLQLLIDGTIESAWKYYMDKIASTSCFYGPKKEILTLPILEPFISRDFEYGDYLNFPHISFMIEEYRILHIAPLSKEDNKMESRTFPPLTPEEIGEFLIWFDEVAGYIEEEVRSLYMQRKQENMVKEIITESVAPYTESLSNNYNIVSYVSYLSDEDRERIKRLLEQKENSVRCSFATFSEYKACISRRKARTLMSDPAKLIALMQPVDKKPSYLSHFSSIRQRNYYPEVEDSFLREMRELAFFELKGLGIAVSMTLLKNGVKIHAIQYKTSKRHCYHISEVFDVLSNQQAIADSVAPFKFPTNFISHDPKGYGDCY
ncbi:MAG: hypothetical protein MJZ16_08205 [Bacteroidales bacterium]|nr:hypothetical protein [Bacteroidales bacterium]